MNIATIGANGAVGKELQKLLPEAKLFDSKNPTDFSNVDVAFFCVSEEVSKKLIPEALKKGVLCIDASSAFRNDPSVPLVIPEINGHLVKGQKLIASPNCTTTLMLLSLGPLHQTFGVKRVFCATYQAVSGAGTKGINELERMTKGHFEETETEHSVFPTNCAFNVFRHEAGGKEEAKMASETAKILGANILVNAICVRVPVFRVHSLALNVELEKPFQLEEIESLLQHAPGLKQKKNLSALDASNKHSVYFDALEQDPTKPNTINLWMVGDQLLKGAALNMKQIYDLCL